MRLPASAHLTVSARPCENKAGLAAYLLPRCSVTHILCNAGSLESAMRNITVSVDEETHRLARVRAAELDTSVSALVRDYLRSLADGTEPAAAPVETELERRTRLLAEVTADFKARGVGLRMSENLPRDELYDRNALR